MLNIKFRVRLRIASAPAPAPPYLIAKRAGFEP
jgi:hypothetical protein